MSLEGMKLCPNPWCKFKGMPHRIQISSYMEPWVAPEQPGPARRIQEYHVRCQCGMKGPYRQTRAEAVAAWNETPADARWIALLDEPSCWEARLYRWNKYLFRHYEGGAVWGDRYPEGLGIREFVDRMLDPQALATDLAKPRRPPKAGRFDHAGGPTHTRKKA